MKPLHITFIALNFYPENTAIGLYTTQWVDYLEAQGHTIEVITAFPYYPQWEIAAAYKNKSRYVQEKRNSVTVHRYKQYVPKKPSFLKRVAHIIDFTLGSRRNLKKIAHTDVVISIIPFTSSAWLGNTLSRKRNAQHWIHIQDFEFDAAFQSGMAGKKGFMYGQLMKLERRILDKAQVVSTISHAMMRQLSQKTNTAAFYLPNWIETQIGKTFTHHPLIPKDKFVVLYSGNIGDKQDWTLFEQLVNEVSAADYHFIVVGHGAQRGFIETLSRKHIHVTLHDPVPYNELSSLLQSASVHVLFQKTDVLDTVMPSKILGMMASARPSIITGHPDSEVRIVIEQSGGGFYESDARVVSIKGHLETLRSDAKLAQEMGRSATVFVHEQFAKNEILATFTKRLATLTS